MNLAFYSIAPRPSFELDRQRVVDRLDLSRRAVLTEIAARAAAQCEMEMAAVAVVDREQMLLLGSFGWGAVQAIPRALSLCSHVVAAPEASLFVPDLREDPRFRANPLVSDGPRLRCYYGVALHCHGQPVGTVCVMDRQPRERVCDDVRAALATLAAEAERVLLGH